MTDLGMETGNALLFQSFFDLSANRTHLTKTQYAYAEVRRAIVTHSIPASTPLDETYLLSLFPVGRTPLREALKRLEHEGFLSWPAHQAPLIRDINVHEMRFLYETRRLLEPTIARLAAQRCTTEDRPLMERALIAMEDASASGNIYLSVEHDYALHTAIARTSHNRFLAESSSQLNLQSLRIWYRAQERHGIAGIEIMHRDLVHAISCGNAEEAEHLAISHISSSLLRQQALLGEKILPWTK